MARRWRKSRSRGRAPSLTSTPRRHWRRRGWRRPGHAATLPVHQFETPLGYFAASITSGEGLLTILGRARCAIFAAALIFAGAGLQLAGPAQAAGAFAVGKCGAYGQAIDYPAEAKALAAARKQCKGQCSTMTMKRACAAFAVDITNPCGAHGYAVKPQ